MQIGFLADEKCSINMIYNILSEEINPICDTLVLKESESLLEELASFLNIETSIQPYFYDLNRIIVCYRDGYEILDYSTTIEEFEKDINVNKYHCIS